MKRLKLVVASLMAVIAVLVIALPAYAVPVTTYDPTGTWANTHDYQVVNNSYFLGQSRAFNVSGAPSYHKWVGIEWTPGAIWTTAECYGCNSVSVNAGPVYDTNASHYIWTSFDINGAGQVVWATYLSGAFNS